jgi:hypothetical protein
MHGVTTLYLNLKFFVPNFLVSGSLLRQIFVHVLRNPVTFSGRLDRGLLTSDLNICWRRGGTAATPLASNQEVPGSNIDQSTGCPD